jgi:hypothetical protein
LDSESVTRQIIIRERIAPQEKFVKNFTFSPLIILRLENSYSLKRLPREFLLQQLDEIILVIHDQNPVRHAAKLAGSAPSTTTAKLK